MSRKRQPKLKGGSVRMYPTMDVASENAIERLCRIWGVSRSWVIRTLVNDQLRIKGQMPYYAIKPLNIRRVK